MKKERRVARLGERNSYESLAGGTKRILVDHGFVSVRCGSPALYGVEHVYPGAGSHALGPEGQADPGSGELHLF